MKERIRKLRKELGLNQTDFGSKIGVKQGTIAGYENGSRQPIDAVISAICKEWNVSENWLRNGTGEMHDKANRNQQLRAWADKVLAEKPENFRYRFVNALSRLPDEWWELTEKAAIDILSEYDSKKAEELRNSNTAAAPKNPAEMTREELHADMDAQYDAEESSEKSQALRSGS